MELIMMRMSRVWLIFMLLLGYSLQGYIYELKVLRRWDDAHKRYQYFIGLSDFHDKTHVANKQQRDFLTNLFKRCAEQNPKIIVEDISSHGAQGRMTCGRFYVDSHGGILGGLTKVCQSCGIQDVDNIEYRYCRVTSLGPIINNVHTDLKSIPSSANITVNALLQEVDAMISEIKEYDDGDHFNKYYHNMLAGIKKEVQQLKLSEYEQLSVADYLHHNQSGKDRFEFVKKLLTFDSALLDAKMIHHINGCTDSATIIGIAGGAHIARVSDELEKAGYELIYSSKVTMMRESDPRKCIGCTMVDGTSCLKPRPIDISIINRYI
jgi:hypothetical protein